MNTRDVARFVTQLKYNDLPAEVVDKAKLVIRDTLAVALAARNDRAVRSATIFGVSDINGKQQASILGTRVRLPCVTASLVNALMTSTLDMDETCVVRKGDFVGTRGHPGCVVIPVSLAVAEWQQASGKQFLEAVVIGYEVTTRSHSMMLIGGLLSGSGVSGAYGATAAASKLLGLDEVQTVQAFGICDAHRPTGVDADKVVAMTKEICGWGAMTGVASALLAKAGFEGPRTIFDIPQNSEKPLPKLGEIWEIMSSCFKEYSACYGAHSAIDGVLELVGRHSLKAGDIAAIRVEGSSMLPMLLGRHNPNNVWQAQYSIPFTIGAAIVDGEVGPEQIADDRLSDPAILNIAERVQVLADKEIDEIPVYGRFAARVSIETMQGQQFETCRTAPRGVSGELTGDELQKKFTKLVTKVLGTERTKSLNNLIMTIDQLENMENLLNATTGETDDEGR